MTALITGGRAATLGLPTPQEIRAMLRHPAVAATAIVCATLVILAALAGIVILARDGKTTEAIGALILGILGLILGRLGRVERQANGTLGRVLDAALPPATDTTPLPAQTTTAGRPVTK